MVNLIFKHERAISFEIALLICKGSELKLVIERNLM